VGQKKKKSDEVRELSDLRRDTRVTFFRIDFVYDFSFFLEKMKTTF